MLSEKVNQEQELLDQFDGGYSVSELTIENNQASVSYCAVDEALLVVALYSEDGLRLLTSGQTQVTPEGETAVVTFEGEMPEYFIAKAYIINSHDYSPLCPVYETPMYTMQMQQLLSSTVDDYDPALVLNLDEDGEVNNKDVEYILWHTLFPEDYPL